MCWLIARRLRDNYCETIRFYLQFDGELTRQLHQHGRYICKMLHGATVLAEHSCATHQFPTFQTFGAATWFKWRSNFQNMNPNLCQNAIEFAKARGCRLGQVGSKNPNVVNPCVKSVRTNGAKTHVCGGGCNSGWRVLQLNGLHHHVQHMHVLHSSILMSCLEHTDKIGPSII